MPTSKPTPSNPKPRNYYFRYANMGIQMAVIIVLGVWCGVKLDHATGMNKFPLFTILLSLVSVVVAIYMVVKDLLKK